MTKIWQRFLFFKTARRLLFLICAFFLIYVLIDYANHTGHFHHKATRPTPIEFFYFYLGKFFLELDLLLPFAFAVASLTVLCSLNTGKEMIALFSAQISPGKMARPLLLLALISSGFLLLNQEYLSPALAKRNQLMLEGHLFEKDLQHERESLHKIVLDDRSILLFTKFDRHNDQFQNVIWVQSPSHFYRIDKLNYKNPSAAGEEVEEFERAENGHFVEIKREPIKQFEQFPLTQQQFRESAGKETEHPLSSLLAESRKEIPGSEKEARLKSELYFRLVFAQLPLLILLLMLPDCFVISRYFSTLKVVTKALFILALIVLSLNAFLTLGMRQILSPELAAALPLVLLYSIALGNSFKPISSR